MVLRNSISDIKAAAVADLSEKKKNYEVNLSKNCGRWVTPGRCSNGHYYAKGIYCGREWCVICGAKGSPVHKRRIARISPKCLQIKEMGYFVIEFPLIYRELKARYPGDGEYWCYTKKDLNSTTKIIIDVMAGKMQGSKHKRKDGYFDRGLLRWHWFGDRKQGRYNPHVNILVDSSFIPAEKLAKIKSHLREKLNCPDLIVNYEYAKTPGTKYHLMEYITRSTFLKYQWSPWMAGQIYNFRNQRWWGKWNSPAVWSFDDIAGKKANKTDELEKLEKRVCPKCGEKIEYVKPVDSTWLKIWQAEEIDGSGYYRIPLISVLEWDIYGDRKTPWWNIPGRKNDRPD